MTFVLNPERIGKILSEIERRKGSKKDFLGDSRKFRVSDTEGQLVLTLEGADDSDAFSFNRNGKTQLASFTGIPKQFFDHLDDDKAHRGELARLTTHLLHTEPKRRLVRTLDGKVRAILSPGYRLLDNSDLFFLAAEEFGKVGAEIVEARLTDDSFRIYAIARGLTADIAAAHERGEGWKADPDTHTAGVVIGNSETGRGKLYVNPLTLRDSCANWQVYDRALAQIHLGRQREDEGWISEGTKRLEDKVIWNKVRDVIRVAFDPKRFQEVIAKLNGAKADEITDPVKAVEAVVETTGLPKSSIDAIRDKFIKDRDFTRYGLLQAVTFQTHTADTDEAKDAFDDAGAKVLAATAGTFSR